MSYTFEYISYYGKDPEGHPITKKIKDEYVSLDDVHKWIKTYMLPQSIWWISYQIMCNDNVIEEKINPNLDEELKSR
jgi:hypothetical protein